MSEHFYVVDYMAHNLPSGIVVVSEMRTVTFRKGILVLEIA